MSQLLDLSSVIAQKIGKHNYFKEAFEKFQIYLSHTVSHPNPKYVVQRWVESPYKMASCFVIAGAPYPNEDYYEDGQVHQCFHSRYWAFHLGVHSKGNHVAAALKTKERSRKLEKHSISITLSNAGGLSWESGRFYASFRKVIPENQVIEYPEPVRGIRFFHRYTDAQIESLKQVLLYLNDVYNIPLTYHSTIWDINEAALQGEKGVFTKNSVRSDLVALHPQPELLEMLISL